MKKLLPHLPALVGSVFGLGACYLRFRGESDIAAALEAHGVELVLALGALAGFARWNTGSTHEDMRRDAGGGAS